MRFKHFILNTLIIVSAAASLFLGVNSSSASIDPSLKLSVSSYGDVKSIKIRGTLQSTIEQAVTLDVYYGETIDTITTVAPRPLYTGIVPVTTSAPIEYVLPDLKENTGYYVQVVNHANPNVSYYGPVKLKTLINSNGYNGSTALSNTLAVTAPLSTRIAIRGTVTSPTDKPIKLQALYGSFKSTSDYDPTKVTTTAPGYVLDTTLKATIASPVEFNIDKLEPKTIYYVKVVDAADPTKPLIGPVQVTTTDAAPTPNVLSQYTYGTEYKPSPNFAVTARQDTSVKDGGTIVIKGTVTATKASQPSLKVAWGKKSDDPKDQDELRYLSETIFSRPLNVGDTGDFSYTIAGAEVGKQHFYKIVDASTPSRAYTNILTAVVKDYAPDPVPGTDGASPDTNFSDTASEFSGGIVPCVGVTYDNSGGKVTNIQDTCNFDALIKLANNVIKFAIRLALPLFAIAFAYAGWLYLRAGASGSEVNEKAKEIFTKSLVGLLWVLGAWLVVSSLLAWLLNDSLTEVMNIFGKISN